MNDDRGQKNWESSCEYKKNTGGYGQEYQSGEYQDSSYREQNHKGQEFQGQSYQNQEWQGRGGYQNQEWQGQGYQNQEWQGQDYRDPGCQNQSGQEPFWQENGQPRQDPSVIRDVRDEVQQRLPSFTAIFSGKDVNYDGEVFPGALLNTMFGGVDLDLRHAIFTSDVHIDAMAIFGGIDIKVPDYVNVKLDDTSIFGGAENKTKRPPMPGAPTIYVRAVCIFGGLDIK